MNEFQPGFDNRFRGDRFKGLDKSKTTKVDCSEYLREENRNVWD